MINLAGNHNCDATVAGELALAGVEIVRHEKVLDGEVPTTISGKLGSFTFERYWVVCGDVPLAVACELYESPIGRGDVRARGHCACPPPDTQATYYDADGTELASDPFGALERQWYEVAERLPQMLPTEKRPRFVPDAAAVAARAVVGHYHIDSQEGLSLFVATLRKHVLAGQDVRGDAR